MIFLIKMELPKFLQMLFQKELKQVKREQRLMIKIPNTNPTKINAKKKQRHKKLLSKFSTIGFSVGPKLQMFRRIINQFGLSDGLKLLSLRRIKRPSWRKNHPNKKSSNVNFLYVRNFLAIKIN